MSYMTIFKSSGDPSLQGRITAACAQEDEPDPAGAMQRVIWPVCTASDVEAAYASALAAENPDPGGDEGVVTDAMILSHVQAALGSSS